MIVNLFFMIGTKGKCLKFASSSKSMAKKWVDKLSSFIVCEGQTKPPLLIDGEDKHDNFVYQQLYEETIWSTWVIRHLHVCDDILTVRDLRLLGNFSLYNSRVSDIIEKTFCITNDQTGRTLILSSPCEETLSVWRNNIEKQCQHFKESTLCKEIDYDQVSMVDFYNVLHTTLESGPKLVFDKDPFVRKDGDPFLILSFDGGGVRGILPSLLVERLLESLPNFLQHVSMVTGTSNGSLMAMGLSFGHHPQTLREMTELTSKHVFSEQQARYTLSTAKWSNRFLTVS